MKNKRDWTWVFKIFSASKWNQGGSGENTKHDWMSYTSWSRASPQAPRFLVKWPLVLRFSGVYSVRASTETITFQLELCASDRYCSTIRVCLGVELLLWLVGHGWTYSPFDHLDDQL